LSGTTEASATVSIFDGDKLLGTTTANAGGNWTFTPPSPLSEGIHHLTVTATDAASNSSNPSVSFDLTIDTTAPTLTITATDLVLAAGETTSVTFQFSEAVTAFDETDVDVTGGTLSNFTQVNVDTWTATFTQTGSDAPTISVTDATFTDLAGNPGTGDTLDGTDGFTVDILAPIVTVDDLTTPDTTPPLTGTVDDPTATIVVTVGGIDYAAINNGDGTWSLADNVLPPLAEGNTTITVTATDPAGNISTDNRTITVDTTAPTFVSAETSTDGNSLVLTYDEPLDAANPPATGNFVVNVNGTPITVSSLTISGSTVTLNLATPVTNGDTITASYNDPTAGNDLNAIQDLAGNDAAGFSNSPVTNTVPATPDTTAPTLTITATDLVLAAGETTSVTFQFSEAVTAFDETDVDVTGGTLSNFTQV